MLRPNEHPRLEFKLAIHGEIESAVVCVDRRTGKEWAVYVPTESLFIDSLDALTLFEESPAVAGGLHDKPQPEAR